MAAYFTDDRGNEFERHIGQEIGLVAQSIDRVQLDGHELEYVRNSFNGIRMHNTRRIINFFGDDAVFIAANWK